jgi:thiamine-phosphate pyrophosphorylase
MIDRFYPVVPSAEWVARLVPAGARFIQLRIKDRPESELRRHVREAQAVCMKHGAQLIVPTLARSDVPACCWA